MRRYYAFAAVVVLLVAAGGLTLKGRKAPGKEAAVPVSVSVIRPHTGDMQENVALTGTIVPQSEVTLSSSLMGRITFLACREGDAVSAGQVLVRLRSSELTAQLASARGAMAAAEARLASLRAGARSQEKAQVENTVRQAKAACDNARQNYDRMKSLQTQGAIAQQQLDLAYSQFVAAEAQLANARAQASLVAEGARREDIRAAEASVAQAAGSVNLISAQLANASINAPVSGIVSACNAEVGEMATPGAPLLTIVEQGRLYLEAKVPEGSFARLKRGQQAAVTIDALGGRMIPGKVSEIVPVADSKSRAFKVKILLLDKGARAGMFGRASVTLGTQRDVLSVPADILREEAGGKYLMVVDGGVARRISVKTGIESHGRVQVSGISPYADIIAVGQDTVANGEKVKALLKGAF